MKKQRKKLRKDNELWDLRREDEIFFSQQIYLTKRGSKWETNAYNNVKF